MTDVLDRLEAPAPGPAADAAPTPPTPEVERSGRTTREWIELVATVVVVAGAAIYVLAQLHPQLVVRDTTPTGGDFGAHVWGPAFLRDHLLPHGRLTGWSPDWYAGFPAYHFYMVPPALLAVLFDVVLPYGVALKLVSLAGLVTLPVSAWAFGRLSGLPFPIPPMLSIAAVFFLFDETFTIYGGNIASTMAGEFSFAIALSLSLVYLGVFARGMRTGQHRALAAVLFALTSLCHLIVAFFAIIGTIVLFLLWADRRRFRYLVQVGIVGGLLTAFWILPFWFRGPYMTDMFYERRTDFWVMFFPQSTAMDWVINGLAVVGLVGAVARRHRAGAFLGVMTLFYGAWARVWPQSHLWNARLLPFFYLTRYFLVALGVVEVGRAVGRLIAPSSARADWRARTATLGASSVVAVLALGLHLQNLPGLSEYYDNDQQRWEYGIESMDLGVRSQPAFVDDWARWNYSGYEGKDAYGEYYGVVSTMQRLGQERGCGRALWENNNAQDKYGTPMALMLLPFWTDGCIGSMEGLFFESAGTTPYHFLSTSALSERSSNPVRRLRYEDGQVDRGVDYLRSLGVRYYLAFSQSVEDKADLEPGLVEVATAGPWTVYEVEGAAVVEALDVEPVVVRDLPTSPLAPREARDRWLEVGMTWFQDRAVWPALPASDGPASWQRATAEVLPDSSGRSRPTDDRYLAKVGPAAAVEQRSLPPVVVSDVRLDDDRITFNVDRTGVPVLVRASYFPNWEVSGAWGPYRVAPNFMVVVPTDNEVSLHYGRTPIDLVGLALSGLGVVGVVVLWRRGPLTYLPSRRHRRTGETELFLAWDEPVDPEDAAATGGSPPVADGGEPTPPPGDLDPTPGPAVEPDPTPVPAPGGLLPPPAGPVPGGAAGLPPPERADGGGTPTR